MSADPFPLLIIRCQRCRRRLGQLDAMPDDWGGALTVTRCRTCVIPRPARLLRVLRQQSTHLRNRGVRGFPMAIAIPLADLRRDALKARARRRPVSVDIAPTVKLT